MPGWSLAVGLLNTIVSALTGGVVSRLLERKPKLRAYFGHVSAFRLPSDITIHTHSIVLWNAGQKTVNEVRVVHRILPQYVNVYPVETRHEVLRRDDGGGEASSPQSSRRSS